MAVLWVAVVVFGVGAGMEWRRWLRARVGGRGGSGKGWRGLGEEVGGERGVEMRG